MLQAPLKASYGLSAIATTRVYLASSRIEIKRCEHLCQPGFAPLGTEVVQKTFGIDEQYKVPPIYAWLQNHMRRVKPMFIRIVFLLVFENSRDAFEAHAQSRVVRAYNRL